MTETKRLSRADQACLMGRQVTVRRRYVRRTVGVQKRWVIDKCEPFVGWIVGFTRREDGCTQYYGDEGGACWERSGSRPVALVAPAPWMRPIEVPIEDVVDAPQGVIGLNYRQVQTLLEMFGGEEDPETLLAVAPLDKGHSGPGLYAWFADYPEEGCALLDAGEDDRKCRVCGCTSERACERGCYWVEDDLCSHCAPPRPTLHAPRSTEDPAHRPPTARPGPTEKRNPY